MSIDEIKKLVMRFVDEPWNQGKVEVIDELCAPEYKLRYGTESEAGGREDLKKAAAEARLHSPDFTATVNDIIVEGDRVAYEWTMSGTEDGKFKKTVGITILRISNGKIVEDHFLAGDVKQEQPVE